MEKSITYKEEELKSTLNFMNSSLKHITLYLNMMTEQSEGKRSNLDMSISKDMITDVENIKRCIGYFKILDKD